MHLPKVMPFAREPLYFFTACTAKRKPLLANTTAREILTEVWTRSLHLDGWAVGRYLLMPDHVHFFARPSRNGKKLATWHQTWKSLTARALTTALGCRAPIWQPETFDHILRSAESYAEKWQYVRMNPVRADLVTEPDTWPWQGQIETLQF
jgi:putative transposase